jgi:hypothetical protein
MDFFPSPLQRPMNPKITMEMRIEGDDENKGKKWRSKRDIWVYFTRIELGKRKYENIKI